MGFLDMIWRTKLWDEIDRLDDKVDFLMQRVKTLEMKMKEHGIK